MSAPEQPTGALSREQIMEAALRAIVDLRLDTTPGVTTEQAIRRARIEMREIARAALEPLR